MIHPVILCGGSGTRLWPLSRKAFPKQFIPLLGNKSLLQLTLERVAPLAAGGAEGITCVSSEEHRFLLADVAAQAGLSVRQILEPQPKNTAAAMALAALTVPADALLLFCPADHHIPDTQAFVAMVRSAAPAAQAGRLVTFGVTPSFPSTAYGYIQKGAEVQAGGFAVARFVEKPAADKAAEFLVSGQYLWNAGIFLARAQNLLDALQTHAPDILAVCRQAMAQPQHDGLFIRPDPQVFATCRSQSIDYAVMEPLSQQPALTLTLSQGERESIPSSRDARFAPPLPLGGGIPQGEDGISPSPSGRGRGEGGILVFPFTGQWSDVGSWNAVAELAQADAQGNRSGGESAQAHHLHASRTYIHADGRRPVVALGTKDLLIIDTPDALLVADTAHAEAVKEVVARLEALDASQAVQHRRVARPWGWYDSVDVGPRHQVKRIGVNPGASLSLQMHHHRAEHWVVVSGTAEVTNGDKVMVLGENQSTYIPIGQVHRLANPGKVPLEIIEVQSGSYLGEDDIVRFEDNYGRE